MTDTQKHSLAITMLLEGIQQEGRMPWPGEASQHFERTIRGKGKPS